MSTVNLSSPPNTSKWASRNNFLLRQPSRPARTKWSTPSSLPELIPSTTSHKSTKMISKAMTAKLSALTTIISISRSVTTKIWKEHKLSIKFIATTLKKKLINLPRHLWVTQTMYPKRKEMFRNWAVSTLAEPSLKKETQELIKSLPNSLIFWKQLTFYAIRTNGSSQGSSRTKKESWKIKLLAFGCAKIISGNATWLMIMPRSTNKTNPCIQGIKVFESIFRPSDVVQYSWKSICISSGRIRCPCPSRFLTSIHHDDQLQRNYRQNKIRPHQK